MLGADRVSQASKSLSESATQGKFAGGGEISGFGAGPEGARVSRCSASLNRFQHLLTGAAQIVQELKWQTDALSIVCQKLLVLCYLMHQKILLLKLTVMPWSKTALMSLVCFS